MEPSPETVCLYDHRSHAATYVTDFVLPGASIITCRFGEGAGRILSRVPIGMTHFLFHINLTRLERVPRDRNRVCTALRSRGIVVLNPAVTDISKRAIQTVCERAGLPTTRTGPSGPDDELLIVKSNRNYRGVPERRLRILERARLGIRKRSRLERDWPDYRVLPRSEVPLMLFDHPDAVVERFVEDSKQCLYRAYIAGAHVVVGVHHVASRIKKASDAPPTRRWFLTTSWSNIPSPDERDHEVEPIMNAIERFAHALSLDFGALDIVVDDDMTPYIVDVALTPSMQVEGEIPEHWIYLRKGILAIERGRALDPT